MILYTLQCSSDHQFEEWFANSSDYESKKTAGELCCPTCGDVQVRKAIMAPRIGSGNKPADASCAMAAPAHSSACACCPRAKVMS